MSGNIKLLGPKLDVGDQVKLDFGEDLETGLPNPNNWRSFAEVRAVVDGRYVVRRWDADDNRYIYEVLGHTWMHAFREYLVVHHSRPQKRKR